MDALKFKLTIAYDGTAYQGWQWQKTGTGVQELIETALARLFSSKPRLTSSSRTDTGVHALGMVAHVEIPRAEFKMPERQLALAINSGLPDDIRVLTARRMPQKFHARFDARARAYTYELINRRSPLALDIGRAWRIGRPLDVRMMDEAAQVLRGNHDFTTFRSTECQSKSPVKTEMGFSLNSYFSILGLG